MALSVSYKVQPLHRLTRRNIPVVRAESSKSQGSPSPDDSLKEAAARVSDVYSTIKAKREELEKNRADALRSMAIVVKDVISDEVEYVRGLFTECSNAKKCANNTHVLKKKDERQYTEVSDVDTKEDTDDDDDTPRSKKDPFVEKI